MSNIYKFKDYNIEIHRQPKLGDYEQVFFRITKNDENAFVVWVKISGTESRRLSNKKSIFELLTRKGLKIVYDLIDKESFQANGEYKYTINDD